MKRLTVILAAMVGLFVLANSAEASVLRVVVVETNDVAASVVVAVEYADMASFAAEDSMIARDAEYQATLRSMSQMRKIVSDSLYEELK